MSSFTLIILTIIWHSFLFYSFLFNRKKIYNYLSTFLLKVESYFSFVFFVSTSSVEKQSVLEQRQLYVLKKASLKRRHKKNRVEAKIRYIKKQKWRATKLKKLRKSSFYANLDFCKKKVFKRVGRRTYW